MLLRIFLVAVLLTPSLALAMPILSVSDNGQLLSASNVSVNGELFDVTFEGGFCTSLVQGCDGSDQFVFNTLDEAESASIALRESVFIDGILGEFDARPELTEGCDDPTLCLLLTPFALNAIPDIVDTVGFYNSVIDPRDEVTRNGIDLTQDSGEFFLYAIWSPAKPADVPEPTANFILLIALLSIGALRGRLTT